MKRFKFLRDFWKIKKPGNFDRAAFRMGEGVIRSGGPWRFQGFLARVFVVGIERPVSLHFVGLRIVKVTFLCKYNLVRS